MIIDLNYTLVLVAETFGTVLSREGSLVYLNCNIIVTLHNQAKRCGYKPPCVPGWIANLQTKRIVPIYSSAATADTNSQTQW